MGPFKNLYLKQAGMAAEVHLQLILKCLLVALNTIVKSRQAEENTYPTFAFSVYGKCIPQPYCVPVCLETDNFAFLLCLAARFHRADLLIFPLVYSAKLPENTYPSLDPGAGRSLRCRIGFA